MKQWWKPIVAGVIPALTLSLAAGFAPSALAHEPVELGKADATPASGPLLVDGTVSFAVFAKVARGDRRGFRFRLKEGDTMAVQLLIEDEAPGRDLPSSRLPRVTVVDPAGKPTRLVINERTEFYEPYGGTTYWYLSRVEQEAVPGTYRVLLSGRADAAVSTVVSVGYREVPGQVRR